MYHMSCCHLLLIPGEMDWWMADEGREEVHRLRWGQGEVVGDFRTHRRRGTAVRHARDATRVLLDGCTRLHLEEEIIYFIVVDTVPIYVEIVLS